MRGAAVAAVGGAFWRTPITVLAATVLFALGATAPTRFAGEFVPRLGNEGLLLGVLALSVAFLMKEAGLVALGGEHLRRRRLSVRHCDQ